MPLPKISLRTSKQIEQIPQPEPKSISSWAAIVVTIIMAVLAAYVGLIKDGVSRAEVNTLIEASESRSKAAIVRVENQQDQMIGKLEDIQIKIGILLDRPNKVK